MTDGDLIITVDSDDADGEAETLTLGGAITDVALITLNGGYSADSDDIIEINADLTTGGAITIADADSVNIGRVGWRVQLPRVERSRLALTLKVSCWTEETIW